MIWNIIDLFFIHARCQLCNQIGHKINMTQKIFLPIAWEGSAHRAFYHYKCREKAFKEKLCECKRGWMSIEKG